MSFCFHRKQDRRAKKKITLTCDWCWAEFQCTPKSKRRFCSPAHQDEAVGGPLHIRLRRLIDQGEPDKCWLWLGNRNAGGYGYLSVDGNTRLAHRAAYQEFVGPIPAGMLILHACDTPRCCNYVSHLRVGTQLENMRDMSERNRGRGSRTTWEDRVLIVRDIRAGISETEVAKAYGITASTVAMWVRRFNAGDVFGYDQLLEE